MKKFLFIVAVALTSVGYAQTDKGDWMVGTDFGLSYETSKVTEKVGNSETSQTTNTFKVAPKLDYFVINNLSIGLGLEYRNSKVKDGDTTNRFAVVPQVHYFFPLDTNFKPFLGARVGYGYSSTEVAGGNNKTKWDGLVAGGRAGVAYFVNNGAAVTGYLDYDHQSFKNKDNKDLTMKKGTFGVGIGVAIFF